MGEIMEHRFVDPSSKVLRVGIVTPIQSLDPREAPDFVNLIVLWQIFETLYAPTVADKPAEPLLLKEPLRTEPTVDGLSVYSAPIREGIRFSDGTPMTANHIAESLQRTKSFAEKAKVKAHGDRVFFSLKQPNPRFDLALTPLPCSIVLEKGGSLYGTGAYVPTPGSTLERMRLVRNPYYRKEVTIPEIEFLVFPRNEGGRADKLLKAVKDGQVDFTTFLQRPEIRDLVSLRKSIELGNSTALLYFNTERAVFSDCQVRKAIALAIDREAISQLFFSNPLAYTASGILPPTMGKVPDEIHYNMEKAKALLAKSEVKLPGQTLRLMTIWGPRPYLPRPLQVAQMIKKQIEKLGFAVKIEPASCLEDYYERTSQGDYDLVLAGWVADTPDPANFLEVILSSEYIPNSSMSVMSGINLSRWKNTSMNIALQSYRENRSESSRQEIVRLIREETPLLPLIYGSSVVVHSWRLKNYPTSFFAHPFFASMELRD